MNEEGAPTTGTQGPVANRPDGVVGFVISIVGFFIPLLWIVSLIIAISDKSKSRAMGMEPAGLVKAAFWISAIGLALGIILALFIVLVTIGLVAGQLDAETSGFITSLF